VKQRNNCSSGREKNIMFPQRSRSANFANGRCQAQGRTAALRRKLWIFWQEWKGPICFFKRQTSLNQIKNGPKERQKIKVGDDINIIIIYIMTDKIKNILAWTQDTIIIFHCIQVFWSISRHLRQMEAYRFAFCF